jgi:hypothetical protein
MRFNRIYPLVNIQTNMERSTMLFMGKSTISTGPCSIVYPRVRFRYPVQWSSMQITGQCLYLIVWIFHDLDIILIVCKFYTHTHTHIYIWICYIYIYICSIYIYVYIYVCIYICRYIWALTHANSFDMAGGFHCFQAEFPQVLAV